MGHIIASNGGIAPCLREAKRAVWRAFFANAAAPCFSRAPIHLKLKLLNRCCRMPLQYRCSRWPPNSSQLEAVDRLQRRLIAALLRVRKRQFESIVDFSRRRNAAAGRVARLQGQWSKFWCPRVISWNDHIFRGHNTSQWSTKLVHHNDGIWLQIRRALGRNGRLGTRRIRGHPTTRWAEGVEHALVHQ